MTPRSKRLPAGVHYSRRDGGMWVSWDGRPEGAIWVTHSRDVAYGAEYGPTGETWRHTGYQGADASCRWDRVIRLAADLWPQ